MEGSHSVIKVSQLELSTNLCAILGFMDSPAVKPFRTCGRCNKCIRMRARHSVRQPFNKAATLQQKDTLGPHAMRRCWQGLRQPRPRRLCACAARPSCVPPP